MNDVLRRAMYDANLTDLDLSAELAVDPKTVRNWMRGQMPHRRTRLAVSKLLRVDEDVIWPNLRPVGAEVGRPDEIAGIYPRRTSISPLSWLSFFDSARSEIGILAYSALFLAEDARLVRLLHEKRDGVRIRIALGAPDGAKVGERGAEEAIGEAMAEKIRNSLALLRPLLDQEHVELRLHDTVLYNSMFRSDNQLLVNQHAYGIPAAQSPVYHYRQTEESEMFDSYLTSFEAVWAKGRHRPGS